MTVYRGMLSVPGPYPDSLFMLMAASVFFSTHRARIFVPASSGMVPIKGSI